MYGRIEARMKVPESQGIWPAFWMLGNNIATIGWPACGELDIMEHIDGNNPPASAPSPQATIGSSRRSTARAWTAARPITPTNSPPPTGTSTE